MKRLVSLLLLFVCVCLSEAAETPITYYVQFIQAGSAGTPPARDAKPIGSKLRDRLAGPFAYETYWELERKVVLVKAGQPGKYKVRDQELEIELLSASQKEIRLRQNGKVTQKSRSPVAPDSMAILGSRDADKTWFLVVRRDKPQVD